MIALSTTCRLLIPANCWILVVMFEVICLDQMTLGLTSESLYYFSYDFI